MKCRPIILTLDDYLQLRALLESSVTIACSEPGLVRLLHQELNRSRIVEPHDLPGDVITIDSTLTLRDLHTGGLESYTLVLPQQADIVARRLSVLSPPGASLLGRRQGEEVNWPIPSGWRALNVESVTPPRRARDQPPTLQST